MIPPLKKHGILLFFIALSGISLISSIVLSARQREHRDTIVALQKTVTKLNHTLKLHREAITKTDYYRFQENIFRLQKPGFTKITDSVFAQSRKHGFDPYLVMAIIFVESSFNRYAVSKAGAYGLMQVNYPVWKKELNIERSKLTQIDYNIELGLTILKGYLRETKGDMIKALILYNNGYKYTNTNYHEKVLASNFFQYADIG